MMHNGRIIGQRRVEERVDPVSPSGTNGTSRASAYGALVVLFLVRQLYRKRKKKRHASPLTLGHCKTSAPGFQSFKGRRNGIGGGKGIAPARGDDRTGNSGHVHPRDIRDPEAAPRDGY